MNSPSIRPFAVASIEGLLRDSEAAFPLPSPLLDGGRADSEFRHYSRPSAVRATVQAHCALSVRNNPRTIDSRNRTVRGQLPSNSRRRCVVWDAGGRDIPCES